MEEICIVCNKKVLPQFREEYRFSEDTQFVVVHNFCLDKLISNPKEYLDKTNEYRHRTNKVIAQDIDPSKPQDIDPSAHSYQDKFRSRNFIDFIWEIYPGTLNLKEIITAICLLIAALIIAFAEGEPLYALLFLFVGALWVITSFGLLAAILKIHKHIKNIDRKTKSK